MISIEKFISFILLVFITLVMFISSIGLLIYNIWVWDMYQDVNKAVIIVNILLFLIPLIISLVLCEDSESEDDSEPEQDSSNKV